MNYSTALLNIALEYCLQITGGDENNATENAGERSDVADN